MATLESINKSLEEREATLLTVKGMLMLIAVIAIGLNVFIRKSLYCMSDNNFLLRN